jgi:hypothetical protein
MKRVTREVSIMLTQSRFSYLIELSQSMLSSVQAMILQYRELPALVAEEHKMIQAHSYTSRLEEVMLRKVEIGDHISVAFEELQHCSQQLYIVWGEADCEGQAAFPGDLSNCISMLEGICCSLIGKSSEFSIGVLQLQISRLKEALADFTSLIKDVKPLLELNKTALSTIVQNYQMSTRALIDMCEQAQATYTPQGQQSKSSQGTSTIFVKA